MNGLINYHANKKKKFLSFSILTIFIIWLVYYFINHLEDFKKILGLKKANFIFLVLLYIVSIYIIGHVIRLLINKLGGKISYREGFLLSVLTSLFNFITPFRGGVIISAVYLKKRHNFDYAKYIVSMAGNYIILFLVVCTSYFLAAICLFIKYKFFNLFLSFLFICLFIFLIFLMMYKPRCKTSSNWLLRKILNIADGWSMIKGDKNLIFKLFLLNFIYVLSGLFFMLITYWSFGVNISFFKILYLHSVSFITFFVNITPAALGIYESILFTTSYLINISVSDSLIYALIFRSVGFLTLILLFILFGISFYRNIFNLSKQDKNIIK